MHVASHCSTECCHGMPPSLFMTPTVVPFMLSTTWWQSSSPSSSPSWYTLDFMQKHRNKSIGFKSSDLAGQAAGPFLPIYLNNFRSKLPLILCQGVEAHLHVVDTFVLFLQEAYSLNTEVINLPDISVTRSCYVSFDNMWQNQGIACSPHHMWTENMCSKWDRFIWCGFFCARECEFLVPLTPCRVNWGHSRTQYQADSLSTAAAIHKLADG